MASSDPPGFAVPFDDDDEGSADDARLLYNVVYCSRAAPGVDDAVVDDIIESARRNNPRLGITGLLVYGGDMFFQWLEGPRDEVRQLMDTLHADPRHRSVVELSTTEELRERVFPDWDMERVAPDDIREVLLDARQNAGSADSAEALAAMLAHLESGPLQAARPG